MNEEKFDLNPFESYTENRLDSMWNKIKELEKQVSILDNYKKMFMDCIFEDGINSQIRINKDNIKKWEKRLIKE